MNLGSMGYITENPQISRLKLRPKDFKIYFSSHCAEIVYNDTIHNTSKTQAHICISGLHGINTPTPVNIIFKAHAQ